MKTIVYSLRTVNDKSTLAFDLVGHVISDTQYTLQIRIQKTGELIYLQKWDYLNKMNVHDNGEIFFIVCTKKVSIDSVFTCLMNHAIDKVEKRVDTLLSYKQKLQRELVAA